MLRRSLVLGALCAGAALAYVPTPSATQVQAAFTEGQQLAKSADSGYPLRAYLVYAVADALKLEPQNGAVDAVTVGTPLERTRYASFLSQIGDDPLTVQQARTRADLPDGHMEFIVYAHGMKPDDQTFLNSFSTATLRLGGQTLRPSVIQRSDTDNSQYPRTVGDIGLRFVGTIAYQFAVPTALQNASGTLSFTDASGKNFRLPVNLSRYR